jgi:serine/threonine protein kinase
MSSLAHPNIAQLLAYSFPDEIWGDYYLVYNIAESEPLESFWQDDSRRSRLSFGRRVQIALDIMTVLRFLHVGHAERGISSNFHRDIKSATVFLKRDWTAQLIDCGLAMFVVDEKGPAQSQVGPKGSKGYICPEFSNGEVQYDHACDVYSFGVLLFELWTGRLQNYEDDNGATFNFLSQYVKLDKRGQYRRDLLADADPTFGYDATADALPDFMKQFAELAKKCMNDDHEDVPNGEDVLLELASIRQACMDGSSRAASVFDDSQLMGLPLCDYCRSFAALSNESICRICWDSQQQVQL